MKLILQSVQEHGGALRVNGILQVDEIVVDVYVDVAPSLMGRVISPLRLITGTVGQVKLNEAVEDFLTKNHPVRFEQGEYEL